MLCNRHLYLPQTQNNIVTISSVYIEVKEYALSRERPTTVCHWAVCVCQLGYAIKIAMPFDFSLL